MIASPASHQALLLESRKRNLLPTQALLLESRDLFGIRGWILNLSRGVFPSRFFVFPLFIITTLLFYNPFKQSIALLTVKEHLALVMAPCHYKLSLSATSFTDNQTQHHLAILSAIHYLIHYSSVNELFIIISISYALIPLSTPSTC
jgi:hypothetical protein